MLYLGSQHEARQGLGCEEEVAVGQWSPCLVAWEKLPFYFQLGGTLWSISSATRGKRAQPSLTLLVCELSLRAANLFICKIGLYGATGRGTH